MKHPIEHLLCTAAGAITAVVSPLFMHAAPRAAGPPPVGWDWPYFQDMLILGLLGLIGGLLSLVGLPIPVKSFKEGVVRVLIAGATAAVITGALLTYLPVNGTNPAIRTGVGALVGFLSYPIIRLAGERGLGWLLKWLKVSDPQDKPPGGDRP